MRLSFLLVLSALLFAMSCITPQKGPRRVYLAAGSQGKTPFDAIIVPGIPFNTPGWDSVMKARVLWSYILYKNGYAKNVIYSGAAVYTPYIESVVMSQYGEALGIPPEHIFQDTSARHSTENVYYSYLLAQKLGFKSIALATDPFQSFLLRGFTRRRFETPVYHLPFITDSLAKYNSANPKINPAPAKVKGWKHIAEEQSFGYRFRGTLGRNIDFSQYPKGRVGPL